MSGDEKMISQGSELGPTQVRPEPNGAYRTAGQATCFVCYMKDGWYVETRSDEYGPFQTLRDAENFVQADLTVKQ